MRRVNGGPEITDKCFNCDREGHWANECRRPLNYNHRDRKSTRKNDS